MSVCKPNQDLSILLDYLALLPNHGGLLEAIGLGYQESYQCEKALRYYQKAEEVSPGIVNAVNIAQCYRLLKNYHEALAYYLKAENQAENQEETISNIAFCYRELGDYEKSILYFKKANQLRPSCTWNLGNIGWCYQQLQNYEEGLKYHLLCETLNPHDTWNLDNLGFCYQQVSQHDLAIPYYLKSLKVNPENAWTWRQIAWCYITTGQLASARESFEEVKKLNTNFSEYALMNLGHVHLCYEEEAQALHYYRESLRKYDSWQAFRQDFLNDFKYLGDLGKQTLSQEYYEQLLDQLR